MYRRHIAILAFRVLLLAGAVSLWLTDKERLGLSVMLRRGIGGAFLCVVWIVLVAGMLLRLIPNKRITAGARKHYARSYRAAAASANYRPVIAMKSSKLHKGALISALAWVALNAAVYLALSLNGLLTPLTTVVLMLFYAVCDTVCILFFCPFQAFFLRNRCCADCRIHNWDYLMMCTPMLFIPSVYSISLLLLSAAVVLRWEIALLKNPHYFMVETNENLRCECCSDKLCQLRGSIEQ